MNHPKFYLVSESDGYETFMWADDVVVVPHETLDTERKEQIRDGDTEKLFKHGGSFPAIHFSDLLDVLEKKGLLEDLIEECRTQRWP